MIDVLISQDEVHSWKPLNLLGSLLCVLVWNIIWSIYIFMIHLNHGLVEFEHQMEFSINMALEMCLVKSDLW